MFIKLCTEPQTVNEESVYQHAPDRLASVFEYISRTSI